MVDNPSRAATIETFSFTQSFNINAMLFGTFTCIVDANGFFAKSGLGVFNAPLDGDAA